MRRWRWLGALILVLGLGGLTFALLRAARSSGQGVDGQGPNHQDPGWPQLPDWGVEVSRGTNKTSWPDLPAGQGWARKLGETYCEVLAVGAGLVFLNEVPKDTGAARFNAYRLDDGQRVWSVPGQRIETWSPQPAVSGSALIFKTNPGTAAISVADGHRLWQRDDMFLLAINAAGAWVTTANQHAELPPGEDELGLGLLHDVALLDAQTGKVLQQVDCGRLYGYAGQVTPQSQQFAVLNSKELLLLDGHDLVRRAQRKHPAWPGKLALDDQGLLLIEHPMPPPYAEFESAVGQRKFKSQQELEDWSSTTDYGKKLDTAEVTYLELPSLLSRWNKPLRRDKESRWTPASYAEPALTPDAVLAVGRYTAALFARADGARQSSPLPATDKSWLDIRSGVIIATQDDHQSQDLPTEATQVLALDSGQLWTLPPPPSKRVDWLSAAPGYACYATGRMPGSTQDPDATGLRALVCLRVDTGYGLQAGKLKLIDDHLPVGNIAGALALSPRPTADKALLQRLAAADDEQFKEVVASLSLRQPAQLEAVVQAANTTVVSAGGYTRRMESLRERLAKLGTGIEPQLIAWAEDPQLIAIRRDVEWVMFQTRGQRARDYIKQAYAIPQQAPLKAAGPPWKFKQGDSPYWYLRPTEQYSTVQWVSQRGADGATYTAFTGFNQLSRRHIVLGVDSNSDGQFEELLPTGLEDICGEDPLGMNAARLYPKAKSIELALHLPALSIRHHQPIYAPVSGASRYGRLQGAEYVEHKLELSQLRHDSDSDGLTDAAEPFLLCDPHNPDSDGDGMADAVDPTPNANPAQMDRLARGIARIFALQDRDKQVREQLNGTAPESGLHLPLEVRFVVNEVSGPVAYAPHGERTLWLASEDDGGSAVGPLSKAPRRVSLYLRSSEKTPGFALTPPGPPAIELIYAGSDVLGPPVQLVDIDGEFYPVPDDY